VQEAAPRGSRLQERRTEAGRKALRSAPRRTLSGVFDDQVYINGTAVTDGPNCPKTLIRSHGVQMTGNTSRKTNGRLSSNTTGSYFAMLRDRIN